jgi:uncharacterized membrane protein
LEQQPLGTVVVEAVVGTVVGAVHTVVGDVHTVVGDVHTVVGAVVGTVVGGQQAIAHEYESEQPVQPSAQLQAKTGLRPAINKTATIIKIIFFIF